MPPETELTLPDGRALTLRRHPTRDQPDNLRAWDASDELVLIHLAEHPPPSGRRIVVNDSFGALTVGLSGPDGLTWWGDSAAGQGAARANAAANGLDPDGIDWVLFTASGPEDAGLAVIKVPKSLELLEAQLRHLASVLPEGASVVGAGMTRHVHSSTVELFQSMIGDTTTTRARKKARLLLATVDHARRAGRAPGPVEAVDVEGVVVQRWPGVFGSGGRLDLGTQLLLASLTVPPGPIDVLDLGCGSGVVGAVIASRNTEARLTLTDDSAMAVASAADTFATNLPDRDVTCIHADGLDGCEDGSADLVVVNPPFHRGHEVGDEVAWRMFSDARRVLRPGGHLVAVGNRHLGYHAKLKRLYGGVKVVGSDPQFVVLDALRR